MLPIYKIRKDIPTLANKKLDYNGLFGQQRKNLLGSYTSQDISQNPTKGTDPKGKC